MSTVGVVAVCGSSTAVCEVYFDGLVSQFRM